MEAEDQRIIQIEGLGYGGEGFARTESGRFISIPHTLPGDRVRVNVGEFRRGRAFAHVVEWLDRSGDHVDPQCPHYDSCSGCALRHMSIGGERRFKLDAALQILSRYGPDGAWQPDPEWLSIDRRVGHRFRGRFRVERRHDRVSLGLRALGSPDRVVDIRDCPAQSVEFIDIIGGAGHLLDRNSEWVDGLEWIEIWTGSPSSRALVVIAASIEPKSEMVEAFEQWASTLRISLGLVVGGGTVRTISGVASLRLGFDSEPPVQVDAPWGSWIHASPQTAGLMTDWVTARVRELGSRRLLDLCCGVGTLTFALAPYVSDVLAVDEDHNALAAIEQAAERSGITNVKTRAGRVGKILRKLRRELPSSERPDLVVINPMRRPLGSRQLDELKPLAPRSIIYAGPSAVSAAKDCATIAQLGYRVERVAVANLHPSTSQMMLVVCLSKLN